MHRRPREVPVDKPSAAQSYIPKALLRDDSERAAAHARRWLPTGSKPGASKHHLLSGNSSASHPQKAEVVVTCSDTQLQQLHTLEDEVQVLEAEMDAFVQDFYVAAATFSTHAKAQTALARALLDA